jgi:hypothetical protein
MRQLFVIETPRLQSVEWKITAQVQTKRLEAKDVPADWMNAEYRRAHALF